jgi:hypothetical protein
VAASATHLQGVYLDGASRDFMRRFLTQEPIARIGYSIFVYRAAEEIEVPAPEGFGEP